MRTNHFSPLLSRCDSFLSFSLLFFLFFFFFIVPPLRRSFVSSPRSPSNRLSHTNETPIFRFEISLILASANARPCTRTKCKGIAQVRFQRKFPVFLPGLNHQPGERVACSLVSRIAFERRGEERTWAHFHGISREEGDIFIRRWWDSWKRKICDDSRDPFLESGVEACIEEETRGGSSESRV